MGSQLRKEDTKKRIYEILKKGIPKLSTALIIELKRDDLSSRAVGAWLRSDERFKKHGMFKQKILWTVNY
jgi:hypothetical protein